VAFVDQHQAGQKSDHAVATQSADAVAVSFARAHAFLFRKVVAISLSSLATRRGVITIGASTCDSAAHRVRHGLSHRDLHQGCTWEP
jgi:hypothetical protein